MSRFGDVLKGFYYRHPAIAWLMAANIGVSLLIWVFALISWILGFGGMPDETWLSLSSDPLTIATHPWTLLSYMFTQYSPLHLLFNVLWLWMFGVLLTLDRRTTLWLYICGGLGGALAFFLTSQVFHWHTYLCGSSAAVMGMIAATGALQPDMRLRFMFLGECSLKWFAIIVIGITLLLNWGNPPQLVAHLGGALAGLLYALALKRKGSPRTPRPAPLKKSLHKIKVKSHTPHSSLLTPYSSPLTPTKYPLADEDRLDQLLDKIRISGYDSLSGKERRELQAISANLNRKGK